MSQQELTPISPLAHSASKSSSALSALDWIRNEYKERRVRNPSYSLRAYARSLKVQPGRLSEILSTKRNISQQMAEKFADHLGFDPKTRSAFLATVERDRSISLKAQSAVRGKPRARYEQISEDRFNMIADWYHLAILSLLTLPDFQDDSRWIARRLGISSVEARDALERLERLGLVTRAKGSFKAVSQSSFHEVSSVALRKFHAQRIEMAKVKLEEVEPEFRDVTAITMPIDMSKLPLAKEMIKSFRRKLSEFLEAGTTSEVYGLNIQLVPLTVVNEELKRKSS